MSLPVTGADHTIPGRGAQAAPSPQASRAVERHRRPSQRLPALALEMRASVAMPV
jgi:hypothetical protein